MSSTSQALIDVLEETKRFLSQDSNDYSWSSWNGPTDACEEIDRLIQQVREGKSGKPIEYQFLFAATGPIQEVSLSSGWGKQFLKLSRRADKAIKHYFDSSIRV